MRSFVQVFELRECDRSRHYLIHRCNGEFLVEDSLGDATVGCGLVHSAFIAETRPDIGEVDERVGILSRSTDVSRSVEEVSYQVWYLKYECYSQIGVGWVRSSLGHGWAMF